MMGRKEVTDLKCSFQYKTFLYILEMIISSSIHVSFVLIFSMTFWNCFAPYGAAISNTDANSSKLSDTAAVNIIFANKDAIQEKGYYWH